MVLCQSLWLYLLLDIVRKHYHGLCKAISDDVERCVAVLLELDILPDEGIDYLYSCTTTSSKKEAIIDMLIVAFVNQESLLPLCDVVEALIEDPSMKVVVQALRHGEKCTICNTISQMKALVSLVICYLT